MCIRDRVEVAAVVFIVLQEDQVGLSAVGKGTVFTVRILLDVFRRTLHLRDYLKAVLLGITMKETSEISLT